ncbi:MAG: hypothetical protein ABR509_05650 [Candidatus Limnocylindria bacterium]
MAPLDALPYVNWLFWAMLSAGTLAVVALTELLGGTTRGYRLFMSWFVLATAVVLVVSGFAVPEGSARSSVLGLALAFGICCLAYLVCVLFGIPRAPLGLAAAAGGVTAAAAVGLSAVQAVPAALFVAQVVAGGLALGSVSAAMLLGHWYLVTPRLSPSPLRRMVWLLLGALAAQAGLFGLALLVSPGDAVGVPLGWLTWLRLVAGTLLPLLIGALALLATRAASLQASTGLLYVALALVAAGSIAGTSITYLTGVPV